MGVTSITPLHTAKVHRNWTGDKENQRLEKIMISGCEQAKQYALTSLAPVQTLQKALSQASCQYAFVAEPTGISFKAFAAHLAAQQAIQKIALFIGPEGGFTIEEREQIIAIGAKGLALTPSILRSQEAVAVMVGSIRSLLTS
jgi:16S rRNA (uracil1498-N3)-methyltransferase